MLALVFSAITFFFSSCSDDIQIGLLLTDDGIESKDDRLFVNAENIVQKEMISIMSKYLFLRNDSYFLEISMNEAKMLGVSLEEYTKMSEAVRSTNEKIKELRKDNRIELNLVDPQKMNLSFKSPRFKMSSTESTVTYNSYFTMSCTPAMGTSSLYTSILGTIALSATSNYFFTIFSGKVATGFGNINFAFQPSSGLQTITLPAYPTGFRVSCATNSSASNLLLVSYSK